MATNFEVKADDGKHASRLEKAGTGGLTRGGAWWEVKNDERSYGVLLRDCENKGRWRWTEIDVCSL